MGYRMNFGNELAQIIHCKTQDEILHFIKDHNLNPTYLKYDWNKDEWSITFNANWTNQVTAIDVTVTVKEYF